MARSPWRTIMVALLACACAGQPSLTQPPGGTPLTTGVPPTRAQPTGAPPSPPLEASPTGHDSPAPASPTSSPAPPPLAGGQLAWTELPDEGGPGAREDHTFTLAADGMSAYLFGGRAGERAFDDLWRYDLAGGAWQSLTPAPGPEPRFGHVAVWVGGLGLVVWSGQQSDDVFFADIWAYDPSANEWRELPNNGDVPPARYGSCGAIGPDGRLWISHGFTADAGRFFDTRAYDFAGGAWTDLTPDGDVPVLRCLHDCLWTPDGQLVLYAGQTTGAPAIGDLWSFDPASATWLEQARPPAEPRQLYALAAMGGSAFIFGGGSADRGLLDDLWLLDLADLVMSPAEVVGEGPSARSGATLVADEAGDRLLLFGGKGAQGELADLWQLSRPEAD